MITVRSIAGADFGGDLGPINYLEIADGAATPTTAEILPKGEWVAHVLANFRPPGADPQTTVATGDALFVAHGFADNPTDVLALHDKIVSGLAQPGIDYAPLVISFDWPSEGKVYAYLEDLDLAAQSAIAMVNAGVRPLLAAQTPNCQVRINALGHSLGAFVLRKALGHADDGITTGTDWMLGQLALVAGDVEASSFANGDTDTRAMLGHAYRLTNYFNQYDEVLAISNAKRAGVEERVGRVGLPQGAPTKTVNVNCSERYHTLTEGNPLAAIGDFSYSHHWYFTDALFFRDLALTLKGGQDRNVIAKRTVETGRGFALAAA
jgi:hypothetical protein